MTLKENACQLQQMFEDLYVTCPAEFDITISHSDFSGPFVEDPESTIAENEAFERFMTGNGHIFGSQHWPVLGKALVADIDTLGVSLEAELKRATGQDVNSENEFQDSTANNVDMFFGMAMSLVEGKEDAFKDAFKACAARMLSVASTASDDADAQHGLCMALNTSQTQVGAKLARLQVPMEAIARVHVVSIACVDATVLQAVEAMAAGEA